MIGVPKEFFGMGVVAGYNIQSLKAIHGG
jgi:hypothetical protein